MTASDISAQVLDYIEDIELIRTKCGRFQGVLSGELRKKTQCLEKIIKALQSKAETSGDPRLFKSKINELLSEIRKNKMSEEKRKREMEITRDNKRSQERE